MDQIRRLISIKATPMAITFIKIKTSITDITIQGPISLIQPNQSIVIHTMQILTKMLIMF